MQGAAAATDASDSSDEEDFDDDQMFQMDDKIAAALRVMARGGANARESREAISAFKFRVIGLIEAYIKKVSAVSRPPASACTTGLLTAATGAVMAQDICTIGNAVRSCLRQMQSLA